MNKICSDTLINRLKTAKCVGILTGAGVSAEGSVPTFRDKDGLWNKYSPAELANMDAFMQNPELVWEWYKWRQKLINAVEPNPGHYALVELEKIVKENGGEFYIITQNVDSLHIRAGSKNVYELHGNIMLNKCLKCDYQTREIDFNDKNLPKCPVCSNLLRPGVVWFGEMLPQQQISKAYEIAKRSDVFFSIGTSSLVYPAAMLPVNAGHAGAYVVEINIQRSDIADVVDEVLIGKSGEILPEIVKAMN